VAKTWPRFEALDSAIMTKAFRGELVPQDPNDEPADVMLARLKSETNGNTEHRASKKQSSKRSRGTSRGARQDEA
jgi:type I restriction enzyme S subunit